MFSFRLKTRNYKLAGLISAIREKLHNDTLSIGVSLAFICDSFMEEWACLKTNKKESDACGKVYVFPPKYAQKIGKGRKYVRQKI